MSDSQPSVTISTHTLDEDRIRSLWDKLEIAQLEFGACDELIKRKRLGAHGRRIEKAKYRNALAKAKKAIRDLGLDRTLFAFTFLESIVPESFVVNLHSKRSALKHSRQHSAAGG
jgi:hypothetical protein